jgi:hypothetical protein
MIAERNIMETMNTFTTRFGIENNETPETASNKRELTTAQKIGIGVVVGAAAVTVVATAVVQTSKATHCVINDASDIKDVYLEAKAEREIKKAAKKAKKRQEMHDRLVAAGKTDAEIAAILQANFGF